MFFKLSSPSVVSGPSGSSEQMGEGLIGQDNKSGLEGEGEGFTPQGDSLLGKREWVGGA